MDLGSIVILVAIGIFAVMAILLLTGRGSFFLVGRTFKSREEMERFDGRKMVRFMGVCIAGFDVCMILAFVAYRLQQEWLGLAAGIIIVLISIGATIYTKTGERFVKDEYLER
ncbi:MAG: DUF3784 domain-containing protein [Eubacteriales bacterium]|nr:DUF3784 domain-containing protein [Eubacteriales bacterium]